MSGDVDLVDNFSFYSSLKFFVYRFVSKIDAFFDTLIIMKGSIRGINFRAAKSPGEVNSKYNYP